jgi:hypothetical protein
MPGDVAVLTIVEWKQGQRAKGFAQLAFGRWLAMRNIPGLTFFKSLGSGRNGGFQIVPGLGYQGLFCVFTDEAAADNFIETSRMLRAFHANGRSVFQTKLRAYSSRGSWSGVAPFHVSAEVPHAGPIASLTRASIRPSKAWRFWRHSPTSEASLTAAGGCILSVGLGEAPVFRQATFTIWEDQAAMDRYARSGAHLDAIRAARSEGFFSEDMFTRFVPYSMTGHWNGRNFSAGDGRSQRADMRSASV